MYSSYNITAYVDTPASGADGVLLSIGGLYGGLSLYVQNKHLVFDYNYLDLTHYNVPSKSEVPTGSSVLSMAFKNTGNHKGVATLYINGHEEGSVRVMVEGWMYSIEEGLEIGMDSHTPVTDSYKSPFQFNGTIDKVVMDYPSSSEVGSRTDLSGGSGQNIGKRVMDFAE
jgi:hypothetical protein